jgi:LysM domain
MFGSGLKRERTFDIVPGMSRTRVRRRRTAAALLLSGFAIACLRATPGSAASPSSVQRYVIRPGDTLWSIAQSLEPSEDPRRVVDLLEQRNGLEPDHLVPGRSIVVSLD